MSVFQNLINHGEKCLGGRITSGALVDGTGGTSFTKKYKTHYIEAEDGSHLPFVFNDIMGLESDKESGAKAEDIIKAINGSLQEGFNFKGTSPNSEMDLGYRSNPSVEDKTYCLVNIIAADKMSLLDNGVIDKMKKIRQAATHLNMPQVIIMTRADLACPLVQQDIRKIYSSKKIKEKMEVCSNLLGIPMNYIFPVKNYHEEIQYVNYKPSAELWHMDVTLSPSWLPGREECVASAECFYYLLMHMYIHYIAKGFGTSAFTST
ncbi:interferon-induced protein 44-like isoform X2 [Hemibagrus wyckioides]|uniref:interferon-induced protein 44-like isoform X2 n=1 Tax=Hemibagrus wyckioides TaxID=337641 RepID=UPI00266D3217|nr:interferon-induced protein 44-like isoform X2 [Hemibagrus wyckioides]